MTQALIAVFAGLGGVVLGAWFSRSNEKRATNDRLLVETLSEIVGGISDAASGDAKAQARYASAMGRLTLHGSPRVVTAFRDFQDRGETVSPEGRRRLISALLEARHELQLPPLAADDVAILLFGSPTQIREPDRTMQD